VQLFITKCTTFCDGPESAGLIVTDI